MRRPCGRFLVMGVSLIATLIAVGQGSPARSLSRGELSAARGGGAQASKCEESCDRYNNYADDCNTGAGPCLTCTKGTTITNYLDQTPLCGAGGFKLDPVNSTDCGKIQDGQCKGISNCVPISTRTATCNDPQNVTTQP